MRTKEQINKIISDILGIDLEDIKPESHFFNDLGGDSLDHIEVIMDIENHFDIRIPTEQEEGLYRVEDFYQVIHK